MFFLLLDFKYCVCYCREIRNWVIKKEERKGLILIRYFLFVFNFLLFFVKCFCNNVVIVFVFFKWFNVVGEVKFFVVVINLMIVWECDWGCVVDGVKIVEIFFDFI